MKSIIRYLAVFPLFVFSQWSHAQCDTNDFWVGTVTATSCITGDAKNNAIEGVLESWLAPVNLSLLTKYEADEGVEAVDGFASVLSVSSEGGSEFSWNLLPDAFVNDAVFVVKQASASSRNQDISWVAYSFGDILVDLGGFFTNIFNSSNYSYLALFGSDAHAHVATVPEIDASSAGIALALALGLVALIRERRFRKISQTR